MAKKNMFRLVLLLLLFPAVRPILARIHYVRHAVSSPGAWSGRTPVYFSISEAIQAANKGDSIWVAPGKYDENIRLRDGIKLFGGFLGTEVCIHQRPDVWDDIARATIDGVGSERCITTASDNTIDGFRLTHGDDIWGAGVGIAYGSDVQLRNLLIESCRSSWAGAGIYVETLRQGTILIENVIIWKCQAVCGALEIAEITRSHVIVRHCTIVQNSAYGLEIPYHAGLRVATDRHEFYNCIVWDNYNPRVASSHANIWAWARDFIDYSYVGNSPWFAMDNQWGLPATHNIFESQVGAPGLIDPHQGNFYLTANSPCIGAGRGGVDLGALPFQPDRAPKIKLSTSQLDFGEQKTTLTFTIFNAGGRNLVWNLVASEKWITRLTPATGMLPPADSQHVTVNIDRTGLAEGDYSGMIQVNSNAPQQVINVHQQVSYNIPWIEVAPSKLTFALTLSAKSSVRQFITLHNRGQGKLEWTTQKTSAQNWLVLTPLQTDSLSGIEVMVTKADLIAGVYVDSIVVMASNAANSPVIIPITLIIAPPFTEQRVNCGSDQDYQDVAGNLWQRDQAYWPGGWGYVGGATYTHQDAIVNTLDDALYHTSRYNLSSYQFDLPNGRYEVTLHFAEIYYYRPHQRIFDVLIENQVVLSGYDIIFEAGHDCACRKTYQTQVLDGQLNLDFNASADYATISAIEVRYLAALSTNFKFTTPMPEVDSTPRPASSTRLQNYPNPFNPATTFSFTLATDAPVQLIIYNSVGQVVQVLLQQSLLAGNYELEWAGTNRQGVAVESGIYFAKLAVGTSNRVIKIILLR
ncbi:T9SS type A sorting domain-containing protein [candidate division KSB1 bacterium]|nr:T9SS type A sorting domain-containing protein [candidate division KSB1 bacterium]